MPLRVLFWTLLASGFLSALAWLPAGGEPPAGGVRTLGFGVDDVSSVRIANQRGAWAEIVREPASPTGWTLVRRDVRWPARAAAVRTLLRALAAAELRVGGSPGAPDSETSVSVQHAAGVSHVMVWPERVGGRAALTLDGDDLTVDTAIADRLTVKALAAMREPGLIPGAGAVDEIRLAGREEASLVLEEGLWSVVTSAGLLRANQQRVVFFLRQLGAMEGTPADGADDSEAGLTITLRRTSGEVHSLAFDGSTGIGRVRLAGGGGEWSAEVAVEQLPLAQSDTGLGPWLSARPVRWPAAITARVEIDGAAVPALAGALDRPAAAVRLGVTRDVPRARLAVERVGGERAELGVRFAGEAVTLSDGRVTWELDRAASEAVRAAIEGSGG